MENNRLTPEELSQAVREIYGQIIQSSQTPYILMYAALLQIFSIVFEKASNEMQQMLNQLRNELNQQ